MQPSWPDAYLRSHRCVWLSISPEKQVGGPAEWDWEREWKTPLSTGFVLKCFHTWYFIWSPDILGGGGYSLVPLLMMKLVRRDSKWYVLQLVGLCGGSTSVVSPLHCGDVNFMKNTLVLITHCRESAPLTRSWRKRVSVAVGQDLPRQRTERLFEAVALCNRC